MKRAVVIWMISAAAAGLPGCEEDHEEPTASTEMAPPTDTVEDGVIVAKVDSRPIFADDVLNLIAEKDEELSRDQALEALIRRELLANEARRRGWAATSEVQNARRKALARVVLNKRIGDGVTYDTLDKNKLRRYYEGNKERFVHGIQRRVMHILAMTGKKGLPDEEARQIAADVAKRAGDMKTKEEFVGFGEALVKEHNLIEAHKGKVKFEHINPFSEDSEKLARPFVEGTFAVPQVGQASPEIKTKFGWHVIFVEQEIPPINQPFKEVAEALGQEVLPQEKTLKTSEFISNLYKNSDVFVFEDALHPTVRSQ